jgi:GntR family transcriptional regulator, sialic acid-inducible nan operon repressor
MCPDVMRDLILEPSLIRRSKLHELVSQKLEDMIRSGEVKPGDRLPSERDIMAAYGIGRPCEKHSFLCRARVSSPRNRDGER